MSLEAALFGDEGADPAPPPPPASLARLETEEGR